MARRLELSCGSNRPGVFPKVSLCFSICHRVFWFVVVVTVSPFDFWLVLFSTFTHVCHRVVHLFDPQNQSQTLDLSSVLLVLKTNQPCVISVTSQALRHTATVVIDQSSVLWRGVTTGVQISRLLSDEFSAAVHRGKAAINRSSKAASMNSWTGSSSASGLSNASHPSPRYGGGVSSSALLYEVECIRWINSAAPRSI